jgi:hypothetical protein
MVAVAAAAVSTAEAAAIGNHQRYKIQGLRELLSALFLCLLQYRPFQGLAHHREQRSRSSTSALPKGCSESGRGKQLIPLRLSLPRFFNLHFQPKNRMSSPKTIQPLITQQHPRGILVPPKPLY